MYQSNYHIIYYTILYHVAVTLVWFGILCGVQDTQRHYVSRLLLP